MKIYANIFAYLNGYESTERKLRSRDRPVVCSVVRPDKDTLFVPRHNSAYELAFPYVKPPDLSYHHQHLEYQLDLISLNGNSEQLIITDEVLDAETVEQEEKLVELEKKLGESLDGITAQLLRIMVGIFTIISSKPEVWLSELSEKLDKVKVEEAKKPLIISLDRRYQLRRKLELIAPKLRHQLRRQAELMPVGRIQEMDAYCLRDYIRRPGFTAAEKAGSKQQLMGVQRYQDYNTAENKFLVYFCRILHLNCYQYEKSGATQYKDEIKKIRQVIDLFKQQPIVQTIQDRRYQFTQPNYVLLQNPIYRSFYQAYLDYIYKRREKDQIWFFRNQLLADLVKIYLIRALLQFSGVQFEPLAKITGNKIPDRGHYLQAPALTKIKVLLQKQIYVFDLNKPTESEIGCDWLLTVEIHHLQSPTLEIDRLLFPLWVFWYRPTDEAIEQAQIYLQNINLSIKAGIIFYLQIPPNKLSNTGVMEELCSGKLSLCQLPNLSTDRGITESVQLMTEIISKILDQ